MASSNEKKEEYKEQEDEDLQLGTFDYSSYYHLLTDLNFHSRIVFISFVINCINNYNIRFQNQSLEIGKLKKGIIECYNFVLCLVVPAEKLDFDVNKFTNIDCEKNEMQQEWFYRKEEFIENLVSNLNPEYFKHLKSLSIDQQKKFYENSMKFLSKIIKLFPKYLLINNSILELVSFLELKEDVAVVKEKMLTFGKKFNLIDDQKYSPIPSAYVHMMSTTCHNMSTNVDIMGPKWAHMWSICRHVVETDFFLSSL